jgi:hypothetical protein
MRQVTNSLQSGNARQTAMPLHWFIKRAILAWVLFIPVAFLNGFIREVFTKRAAGDLTAHQISCMTASIAFVALSYLMLHKRIAELNNKILRITGMMWVLMTMVFEFGLGRYINNVSWDLLFQDYNIFEGRLWILVLLTILFTPIMIKKLKHVN